MPPDGSGGDPLGVCALFGRRHSEFVHSISGGNVQPNPGFGRALVGPYKYGNMDITLYFDDVSISQTALTCP